MQSLQNAYPYYQSGPNPWIGSVSVEGQATNNPCAVPCGAGVGGSFGSSSRVGSWALGLAAGLFVLDAFSSSQGTADQSLVTNVITATSALTFTTAGGVTGEEVSGLRAQVLNLASAVRQNIYDNSLFDYNGRPASASAPVQIAAITQPAAAATSNNSVVFLAIGLLAILAVVFWT